LTSSSGLAKTACSFALAITISRRLESAVLS